MKYLTAALICLTLCSCRMIPFVGDRDEPNPVVGTWELVDICAFTALDSPPYGISAQKYYFAPEGQLYLVGPEEEFDEGMESVSYTFGGSTLTLDLPDEELRVPVEFREPNRMVMVYGARERWTLEKLEGENATNQKIEPRSVAVLQTENPRDQLSNLDIHYETTDPLGLPLAERLVGVWEVTAYTGVSLEDCPPYGFPNDKWVFTSAGEFYMLYSSATSLPEKSHASYKLSGNTVKLFVDGKEADSQQIHFNSWGHLVVGGKGVDISLKLLNKNCDLIPAIPAKIALLTLDGEPQSQTKEN